MGNALKSGISIHSISNPSEKSNPSDEKTSNSLRSASERQTIVDMLNALPYKVEHNEYEIAFRKQNKAIHASYTVTKDLQPQKGVSPYEQDYTMTEQESQEKISDSL